MIGFGGAVGGEVVVGEGWVEVEEVAVGGLEGEEVEIQGVESDGGEGEGTGPVAVDVGEGCWRALPAGEGDQPFLWLWFGVLGVPGVRSRSSVVGLIRIVLDVHLGNETAIVRA